MRLNSPNPRSRLWLFDHLSIEMHHNLGQISPCEPPSYLCYVPHAAILLSSTWCLVSISVPIRLAMIPHLLKISILSCLHSMHLHGLTFPTCTQMPYQSNRSTTRSTSNSLLARIILHLNNALQHAYLILQHTSLKGSAAPLLWTGHPPKH